MKLSLQVSPNSIAVHPGSPAAVPAHVPGCWRGTALQVSPTELVLDSSSRPLGAEERAALSEWASEYSVAQTIFLNDVSVGPILVADALPTRAWIAGNPGVFEKKEV